MPLFRALRVFSSSYCLTLFGCCILRFFPARFALLFWLISIILSNDIDLMRRNGMWCIEVSGNPLGVFCCCCCCQCCLQLPLNNTFLHKNSWISIVLCTIQLNQNIEHQSDLSDASNDFHIFHFSKPVILIVQPVEM